MSNAVSALNGATYNGFVTVTDVGLRGMITLRGNLTSPAIKKAVKAASGSDLPAQGHVATADDSAVAWMSPDELLIMTPYAEVEAALAKIDKALKGSHYLAVNVSDARAVLRVQGQGAREVMAKLSPVDMSADGFTPGMFRRTRMAQIPAAFWMPDADAVQIICFRSVADYAFNLLKDAAQPGSEVGYL